MKKLMYFCLIPMLSCSEENPGNTPVNLIPIEKMIPLIVDLQIMESHFQRTFQRPELYKTSLDSSSALIFKKHLTTKIDFDSSFTYYSADAYLIYGIYEAALDSVNFRLSQGM